MANLICCNNRNADQYFQYLLTKNMHFAIIFIDESIDLFVDKLKNIEVAYYHGDGSGQVIQTFIPHYIYNMAYLLQPMSFANHSLLVKYENKLHKIIPEGYKYCFSYHKEFPFFRSWPIYLPDDPIDNTVIMINPYERSYENLIVQLLYLLKANNLAASGRDISIYHYFQDSLELSKIILHKYSNRIFNMKESDISFEILRFHPLIIQMQRSEIINLENLLAASKELMLKEISRYLKITNLSTLMDYHAWAYSSQLVDGINWERRNLMVCFDGLVNDKESYQPYFYSLVSLYISKGYHIIEIAKIRGKYRIIERMEKELSYDDIFALVKNIDLYIGTDYMLAQVSGLFNITNYTIMFEETDRYNPPLCRHAVLKPNINIRTIPIEKLYNLIANQCSNNEKKQKIEVDIENYGAYTKIEL